MINTSVPTNELPIHQNLSTSFVDLPGMVRHLRALQFVGGIHVELSSYEARIEFTENGKVTVHGMDHIAGRFSFGKEALHLIKIRSKESGGLIHVY